LLTTLQRRVAVPKQAARLEAATSAAAPQAVLDLRGVVDAMVAMLPPAALPPPPSIPGFAAAAATLPPSERLVWMNTAMSAVQNHVSGLHVLLVGMWTDAPQHLAALMARHAAALRDELWAADGRDW
jgi:hypothetical protein